jgi:zinc protease
MKTIDIEEFDLDNGLHCIIHENHTAPLVALNLWYHVGSKNEDPTRTGFAHLFEHLMFQGSMNVGKTEHFAYIQKAGGTLNGSTNSDRTNYYETLPSNQLDLGLWLEADRMLSLNVNQENLENQRQVVMEERRQRYDNAPYGRVYEELHKRAFTNHPYRWVPIGSMEHIAAATLDDVQSFFKKFYAPNNAVLTISGDTTLLEAQQKIERYFATIPKGNAFERPSNHDAPLMEEIRDTIYDHVELPALFMAYRICDANHRDADALSVISTLLSDGRSSRLYRALVHQQQIAQSASAYAMANEHPGLFHISLVGTQTTALSELEKAFDAELQKVITGEVTEHELEKAKNAAEMQYLRAFSGNMGVADTLNYFHTILGEAGAINTELDKITRLTLSDIQRVAKTYLDTQARVVLEWLPRKK